MLAQDVIVVVEQNDLKGSFVECLMLKRYVFATAHNDDICIPCGVPLNTAFIKQALYSTE